VAVSTDVVSCIYHRFECRDLRQHSGILYEPGEAARMSQGVGIARSVTSSCCVAILKMKASAPVQFPGPQIRVAAFHLTASGESHVY
jgi:hypothetical protein